VGFFVLIIFILQGGIYNNNIINSAFLLNISFIDEEKNSKIYQKITKTNYLVQNQEIGKIREFNPHFYQIIIFFK